MNQHVTVACDPPAPQVGDTRARFTAVEFMRMADAGAFDDMKVELVGGELQRMNPPMDGHAGAQARIVYKLASAAGVDRVRGEVGVMLGEGTVVACDAALLRSSPDRDRLLEPADIALVVEVAATTRNRDMGAKRMLYAAADIPTYWVVDPGRAVVHVHSDPCDGDYASIATVRFGEALAVPGTDVAITLA